jgi:pilus assembly protein FimV
MVIPDNGAPGRAAAAALWQAISAQPQEITRNTEQLTQLQAQVDDLRHQSLTLRGALAKTTPPPTPWLPPWLPTWALKAALAAFALLLLGAALALARWWLRHSRLKALRNDWAQSSIVGGLEPFERALAAADMARAEDAEAAREEAQLAEAASTQVPAPRHQRAAPGRVSRLVLPVLPPAMPPEETREETLATHRYESEVDSHLDLAPGTERVAALAVAQLEAEFFCTLGEPGEAASILSHYISEHPQASPLAYLELMELCRARDDREGYDQWRDAMQLAFKGEPPAFEHISRAVLDDSEDCELVAWPWLMERICAHWPSPRSQEEIEELLFDCAPGGPQMLSVQALRELLWLYEVGLTLAENQDGEGAMDEAHPAAARAAAAAAEVPFAGLDFDLGDFSLSQPDRPAPANDSHPTSLHAVAGNDSSRRAAAHV